MEYTPRYLVMVTANNHNKYYRMTPHGDTWTAEFGRVGAKAQIATYPRNQWDKKYREKINKGYKDQTDLAQDLIQVVRADSNYKPISNVYIAKIVDRLQSMASAAVNANYNIASNAVTKAMVSDAQRIIDGMVGINDLYTFNNTLIQLFTVIPRKMSNVNMFLAGNTSEFKNIIKREQDLLDVMRGQVIQHVTVDTTYAKGDKTILDSLGLIFEECTPDDIAIIKSSLGNCSASLKNAWKVTNTKTQARFDAYCKENHIRGKKLLFHGSRNENWWSIINTGLVLRPTNAVITGKMFGYGLYFAPLAQKSLGYTSLQGSYWTGGNASSGFMALMNVATGTAYNVYSFDSKYYNFNYNALQKAQQGASCLHAHAGKMLRNDEIVVYKEDQCTIKYLIELSR